MRAEPAALMAEVLLVAAACILVFTAVAMVGMWWRGGVADQMMSVQLLGSGGVAIMLLLAVASGQWAVLDVALLFAVLAAFAASAFHGAAGRRDEAGAVRRPEGQSPSGGPPP